MDMTLSDQINQLVQENRRLRKKSDADDRTIHILKDQYDTLQAGVEDMIEDHRRRERELVDAANRHEVAYVEMEGLLNRTADLIMQAARARAGDTDPKKMPEASTLHLTDSRIPGVSLS